jgi:hypothetical protein
MQTIEIELPPAIDLSQAAKIMEATLVAAGLEIALRGTLRTFPGCIHWHARNPGRPGTLELTLWPSQRRAWITIQRGRAAEWIARKLPEVQAALRLQLAATSTVKPNRQRRP